MVCIALQRILKRSVWVEIQQLVFLVTLDMSIVVVSLMTAHECALRCVSGTLPWIRLLIYVALCGKNLQHHFNVRQCGGLVNGMMRDTDNKKDRI